MEKDRIRLSFIDLETTGLNPRKHSITEIAIIRVSFVPGLAWLNSFKIDETYCVKVLPKHPYVEPFIAELNGYNPDLWNIEGIPLEVALKSVYDIIEGTIICGSNPSFDKKFLAKGFRKMGWKFPKLKSHHMIDVPSMAAEQFVFGKVDRIGQASMSSVFNIKTKGAHRAINDVMQCLNLFKTIISNRPSCCNKI